MSTHQSSYSLSPNPNGRLTETGARWAVLLLHGFTSGPDSVLPWGQALARAGATVHIPLLAGHGTSVTALAETTAGQWRADVQRELDKLLLDASFTHIAVGGLSMGGALALDAAAHRHIDVTLVVNPGLSFSWSDRFGVWASPLLSRLVPTVGPLAGDVQKPDVREIAYDRTPVAAVTELAKLFRTTRQTLGKISCPVTLYWSPQDHIVPASSAKILRSGLNLELLTTVVLPDSFHVATLDYDASLIHQDSIATLVNLSRGHRIAP